MGNRVECGRHADDLTVPADALNGQHTVNLIIFRLMDTDGNLIGGPVELHLDF